MFVRLCGVMSVKGLSATNRDTHVSSSKYTADVADLSLRVSRQLRCMASPACFACPPSSYMRAWAEASRRSRKSLLRMTPNYSCNVPVLCRAREGGDFPGVLVSNNEIPYV